MEKQVLEVVPGRMWLLALKIVAEKGRLWYVGGCVRDAIRAQKTDSNSTHLVIEGKGSNNLTKDIDVVVTGMDYEKLSQVLMQDGFDFSHVGKSFGVIKARCRAAYWMSGEFDIALSRTEKSTGPGHRDFEIISDPSVSIEEDLKRRDFTINAIAINAHTSEIVDPYNGIQHIAEKKIETITSNSFRDDPLRILRAIQFAARFSFNLSESTLQQIEDFKEGLSSISKERIASELKKGLTNPVLLWNLLQSCQLCSILFTNTVPVVCEERLRNVKSLAEFLVVIQSKDTSLLMSKKEKCEYEALIKLKETSYAYICSRDKRQAYVSIYEALQIDDVAGTKIFSSITPFLYLFVAKVFPRTLQDLAINGKDLIELGINGEQIGIKLKKLMMGVLYSQLENTRKDLLLAIINTL